MSQNNFGEIRVFVEVARRGGFRAAAEHLHQAPASVSEAIQRFEDRLGVRLFERSTRSVALTPIGEQLYTRSLPAVTDLEGALSALDEEKDQVSGRLRLSAPYSAGPFFLDDLLASFAAAYPNVQVEIIYDDKKVDLLTSGIDAAIRSQTMMASDTHAVPVGPELNMTIVAARSYLEDRGTPTHPRDVLEHDAICYAFGRGDRLAPWGFKGPDGSFVMQPKPRLVANDMRSLLHYASRGLGLAYIYREIATPHVANKELVEVLRDHLAPMPRYSINYQSKRHMTRRLRAFIDLAKTQNRLQ
ncbi:LysR substrate-binding domain-containing protein [Epibacterium ulvae]|uniref:LysR substrate-binding domain-containing protein n=1 Tax=Epibacterium ulvae TaxID=1156985 RepID=UPI0024922CB1|nr:LysR substrate-binding domain-containing protein [Epibacterium ulvae]